MTALDLNCTNWSPDSTQILCYSRGNRAEHSIATWDVAKGILSRSISLPYTLQGVFAWSPDGNHILAQTGVPGSWSTANLTVISLEAVETHLIKANGLFPGPFGWLPDNQVIYAAQTDGIGFWNFQTGEVINFLSLQGEPSYAYQFLEHNMESWLSIAISPDGHLLAVPMQDGTVQIVNLPGGELTYTLGAPTPNYSAQVFNYWEPVVGGILLDRFSTRMVHWSPDSQHLTVLYGLRGVESADYILAWDV